MRGSWLVVLMLGGALAACQRHAAPAGSAGPPAEAPIADAGMDGDWQRVWEGVLPCVDCRGIQTRLELRHVQGQQTYVLMESYLGQDEPVRFEQHGDWQESRASGMPTAYQLDPARFGPVYQLQEDGALVLRDRASQGNIPDYRLQRQ